MKKIKFPSVEMVLGFIEMSIRSDEEMAELKDILANYIFTLTEWEALTPEKRAELEIVRQQLIEEEENQRRELIIEGFKQNPELFEEEGRSLGFSEDNLEIIKRLTLEGKNHREIANSLEIDDELTNSLIGRALEAGVDEKEVYLALADLKSGRAKL